LLDRASESLEEVGVLLERLRGRLLAKWVSIWKMIERRALTIVSVLDVCDYESSPEIRAMVVQKLGLCAERWINFNF
jgi:hypothetical protein